MNAVDYEFSYIKYTCPCYINLYHLSSVIKKQCQSMYPGLRAIFMDNTIGLFSINEDLSNIA